MFFLVRGTLSSGGSIFGKNELTTLVKAEVGIGDDYWIIYLMLPPPLPGEKTFDVGQLLNHAFNLGLTGFSIKVENAGFFQLNATSVTYADIVVAFPEIPLPTDPDFIQLAVKNLTCFWAIIDFSSWDIGTSLIQIGGTNDQAATLKLYGFFASGDAVKTTIFEADFPDFTLFNIFSFSAIRIRYVFSGETLYALSGKLKISAFEKDFTFSGLVQKQPNQFFAALTLTVGPKEVTNPFGTGSMPGINFGEFQFALLRPLPPPTTGITSFAWFQTTIKYSIKGLLVDLNAAIYLENTTPILAFIELNQELNIGEIFTNSIPNFTWPSDLINIVFKAGSSIYYCQTGYAAKLNQTPLYLIDSSGNLQPVSSLIPATYEEGFTVFAAIDLTIWKTISFTGNITIGSNHIVASIQLNEVIDLYILTIKAPQGVAGTGPIFKFDSQPVNGSNPYVQLQCSLLFFQEDFGLNAFVTVSRDASQSGAIAIEATLSTTKKYAILGNQPVNLTFTYSKKQGFNVSGWPNFTQDDSSVSQIIDIAKEVTSLMKSTDPTFVCGQITNLIAEQVFTNSFTMSPTFKTVTQNEVDTVYFIVNGTFKVFIAGSEVTSINFPNSIEIPLPQHVSLDSLASDILEALKNAAASFVQSLVNNGEQWAKLAAILFAQKAAQLAAQWLCEGLIDGLTAEAITAGGAAVSSALAGGAGLAGAIGAGLGAIGSIFSSCFTAGTAVTMADGSFKSIEFIQIGDQLKGHNGIMNEVLAYDHPKLGNRQLYAFNNGSFFVTAEHPFLTTTGWKSINPAATLSENPLLTVSKLEKGDLLLLDDGSELLLEKITSTDADATTQLYNFKLSGNNTYIANGLIAHNKGSSCFVAGTEVLLMNGTVKPIEAIQIGDVLEGMDGVPNTVLAFDHPLLGNRSLFAINDQQFFVTAEHPFLTVEGWKAIDPAATARENAHLTVEPLKLGDILILNDGNSMELVHLSETHASVDTQLYNFVLDGNNTYCANGFLVHNKGGGGGGGGSDPNPAQPTLNNPPLTLLAETLTLLWNGASYATGYEVQFFDPAGTQIGNTQSLDITATNASSIIPLNFNGGQFKAQVRSVRGSKRSDWTVASINMLQNATNIQLGYDSVSNSLVSTWGPVSQATSYSVALQLNEQLGTAQTASTTRFTYNADTLAVGTYRVFVGGLAVNTIPGTPVSGEQTIVKPAAPQNINISSSGQQLVVTWDADQSSTYSVQLLKDGVASGEPQTSAVGRVTFQQTQTGSYTAQVRIIGTPTQLPGAWGMSGTINKISAPENVHFSYDAVKEQLGIAWEKVTDNNGYTIQISNTQTNEVVFNGQGLIDTVAFTLPLANFTAGAGMYEANVSAEAKPGSVDSNFTASTEQIQRIDMPTGITFLYNAVQQQLEIGWVNSLLNNGYTIVLYNEHSPEIVVKDLTALKDVTTANIEISQLQLTPGTYQVKISAVASLSSINSLPATSLQGITKAGTPQLQSALFANNLVNLTWTTVLGVSSYKISMIDEETNKTKTASSSPFTFSVSDWLKGNYTTTVIATNVGWIDSDTSNPIPVAINPLSLDALAAQFFASGSSATVSGNGILLAFPDTTYLLFTKTLAHAGYSASDTVVALKEAFPLLTPQEVTSALQAAYGTNNPGDFAKQGKAKGWTAVETGQQLVIVFPGISANDFAIALAGAGYLPADTTEALRLSFPTLTPQEVTAALVAAYGTVSPIDFAKENKSNGISAAQTGQELVSNFPGISAFDFTNALATAGYLKTDTVIALKKAFPTLTPQQFTAIVIVVYGKTDANAYAKTSYSKGLSSVQTGQELLQNFPGISATNFAVALAKAGYTATETTQALKSSFPTLTPQQFTTIIQTAYAT